MPYTLSHVAAVVPVSRLLVRMRMLSAAVIGSLVPDFGYLMSSYPPRVATHGKLALLTFCLPVGMLTYWIFQRLMKTPLVSVLPDQAYLRWRPYSAPAAWGSLRQWLLAACGVLAGAAVHVAWDAFTHEDARGARLLPELAAPMIDVHGHLLTGARLLQGLSSLLGLLVVVGAIVYALRGGGAVRAVTPRALTAVERRGWVIFFVLATLGFTVLFYRLEPEGAQWLGAGKVAIAFLRGLVPAALGFSLLLQGYLRSKR